jgi:hypothetical protein
MKVPFNLAKIILLRFFCIGKKIEDAPTHFLCFVTKWIHSGSIVRSEEWPNSIAYPELGKAYEYLAQLAPTEEVKLDILKSAALEFFLTAAGKRLNDGDNLLTAPLASKLHILAWKENYTIDEDIIQFDRYWNDLEELLAKKKEPTY